MTARNLEKGFLETMINSIPGMNNTRIWDLPLFHPVDDASGTLMHFIMDSFEGNNSKAIETIIYTNDALETDILTALS